MKYTVTWNASTKSVEDGTPHVFKLEEEYSSLDEAVSFLKTLPKAGTGYGNYRITFITWAISCEDCHELPF